jgi:formylmethanofuran dehydrogenase subunit E
MLILYLVGKESNAIRERLIQRFQRFGIRSIALDFLDPVKVEVVEKYHVRSRELEAGSQEYFRFLLQKEKLQWQRSKRLYRVYDSWVEIFAHHGYQVVITCDTVDESTIHESHIRARNGVVCANENEDASVDLVNAFESAFEHLPFKPSSRAV